MELGIDGFTAIEEIGRGGFGVVHLATDEAHGRNVAIKTLTGNLDDSARRQFDRERRAMGRLSGHPNIGVVHTSGFNQAGQPYIVMEYLEGGSLENRLAGGPLPIAEVVDIGLALSDAVAAAHEGGVLHLDLKPANVLLSGFGQPKLVDFGIASIMGDEHATTTIRATPAYAAPEVFDGRPATTLADIYGLGATMYALLVGIAPYTTGAGDPALHILREIAIAPVPTVERVDVPAELRQLLADAMAKDPTQRPATMTEFRDRLRHVASRFATSTTPAAADSVATSSGPESYATPGGDGKRLGLMLIGAAGLIVLIALVVSITRGGGESTSSTTTGQPVTTTTTGAATTTTTPASPTTVGPTLRPVPDVRNLSEAAARTALSNAGFTPTVLPHCYLQPTDTSPPLGSNAAPGASVSLVFPPCLVPDLVGMRLPEAITTIEEINAIEIQWANHCDDLISGQSVPAGTEVRPFEVTITLDLPTSC